MKVSSCYTAKSSEESNDTIIITYKRPGLPLAAFYTCITIMGADIAVSSSNFTHNVCFAETIGLCDVHPVEMLQDQAQCVLGDYVRHKYSRQPTRFGRLLLLIPSLRAVTAATVEKLFFKETIGNIPIERILGDMYNMEKVE